MPKVSKKIRSRTPARSKSKAVARTRALAGPGAAKSPDVRRPRGEANGQANGQPREREAVVRPLDMEETLRARELFWANVIREMLCAIAEEGERMASREAEAAGQEQAAAGPSPCDPRVAASQSAAPPALSDSPGPATSSAQATSPAQATSSAPPGPPGDQPSQAVGSRLDGRFAVITKLGQHIPIAEVRPLFAMGVDRSPQTRALSMAVECSVFQIRTPKGFVYTLPIHEIRCVRAVSEELMAEIEDSRAEGGGPERPFGFAAFTSLARAGLQQPVELPALAEEGWGE